MHRRTPPFPTPAVLPLVLLLAAGAACMSGRDSAAGRSAAPAAGAGPVPAAVTPIEATDANPWAPQVRILLTARCGTCHRSGLTTAKAGAIAVFDLDTASWHETMTDGEVRGLGDRILGSDDVDEADKARVAAFIRCRLEGQCAGDGS